MANHPNRSTWRCAIAPPSPQEVRASREAVGLTQAQAAEIAGLASSKRWQEYEAGERRPAAATWELWLLRTDRHPTHELRERSGPHEAPQRDPRRS